MTERDRRRRLATIKRIHRRNEYFASLPEVGSMARQMTAAERDELVRSRSYVGGEWAARSRGLLGGAERPERAVGTRTVRSGSPTSFNGAVALLFLALGLHPGRG